MIPLLLFIAVCIHASVAFGQGINVGYVVAKLPTPVFNIPAFPVIFGGHDGKSLRINSCEQMKELEFIALQQTVFVVKETVNKGKLTVYKVTTEDYPSRKPLFIDGRFVNISKNRPPERHRQLPTRQEILKRLLFAEGSAYVWGGNIREGIPEMLSLYPPSSEIETGLKNRWTLKGLDCSGLLYEATNGYTPRNTDALIDFGAPVYIAGLKVSDIVKKVEPLDLIAWRGHVIIVLDGERAIESRLDYDKKEPGCQGGVRVRPLKDVLEEIFKSRTPSDSYDEVKGRNKGFVIRRWFP